MILLGTLTVGGRTFSAEDSIGKVYREQLGISDDFYGGSVKSFLKTNEGFLLCLDRKDNILNMGYFENQLSDEGLKLLLKNEGTEETPAMESPVNPLEGMKRQELIKTAKELGVEGRIGAMSNIFLKEKIKEVQNS